MSSIKERAAKFGETQPKNPQMDISTNKAGPGSPSQSKSTPTLPEVHAERATAEGSIRTVAQAAIIRDQSKGKEASNRPSLAGPSVKAKTATTSGTQANGSTNPTPAKKPTPIPPKASALPSTASPKVPTTLIAKGTTTAPKRQSLPVSSTVAVKRDLARSPLSPVPNTKVEPMSTRSRPSSIVSRGAPGSSSTTSGTALATAKRSTAAAVLQNPRPPKPPATFPKPTSPASSTSSAAKAPSSKVVATIPTTSALKSLNIGEVHKGHAAQLLAVERELHVVENELVELKAKYVALEESIAKLKVDHQHEINVLTQRYNDAVENARNDVAREREALEQRHAAELQNAEKEREALVTAHAEALQQASKQRDALAERHAEEVDAAAKAREELVRAREEIVASHAAALQKATVEKDELVAKHIADLANATANSEKARELHNSTIDQLKSEHSTVLADLQRLSTAELEKLKADHSTELGNVTAAHLEELENLKLAHAENLDQLKKTHSDEFERLKMDQARELEILNKQLSETHDTYRTAASNTDAAHSLALDELTKELAKLKASHQSVSKELAATREALAITEQAATELRVKLQDSELKLDTAAESALQAAATSSADIAALTASLAEAREKLDSQDAKYANDTAKYVRDAEEREKELTDAKNEIAALRQNLIDLNIEKEEQFKKEREALIKDHRDTLSHFQVLIENERETVSLERAAEVKKHEALIDSITSELSEKLAAAESRSQELADIHKESLDTLAAEKDALLLAADGAKKAREDELQLEINAIKDTLEMQETSDANDARHKRELLAREETLKKEVSRLEDEKRTEREGAVAAALAELRAKHSSEAQSNEKAFTKEREELNTKLTTLEESLRTIQAEADKVHSLQEEIENVRVSAAAEKQKALDDLKAELEEMYKKKVDELVTTNENALLNLSREHEMRLSELNAKHKAEEERLSNLPVHQELRDIKAKFQRMGEEERAKERALFNEELSSIQVLHTTEIAKLKSVHEEELARRQSEFAAEKKKAIDECEAKMQMECDAIVTRQREELQKKSNSEMKTLSDAHSSKTTSLESLLAEAKAAQTAAEEELRKTKEFKEKYDEASKRLIQTQAELEVMKKKVEVMENGLKGEETPLSDLD